MKIEITQGKTVVIDDADFEIISHHNWCALKGNSTFYSVTKMLNKDGRRTTLYMHRLILGITDPKIYCDHINGDGLDNRRSNLRACSPMENARNGSKQKNNTSGYKGVTWHKGSGQWQSQIGVNGKLLHLGTHQTIQEAYSSYCISAIKYHGEFARLDRPMPLRSSDHE